MTLAGCTESLSIVHPAGPAAATIATLWWVLLAGAAVIFGLVMALLLLALRARAANDPAENSLVETAPDPAADLHHERRWIIGLGLVFPVTVLSALLAYGLVIGDRLLPHKTPDLVTVEAEARQWAWRFAYPGLPGRETEGVLHIPAGRPVDVRITTVDVIHSFWVPRLAGKLDAIPGHVNILRLEADAPGDYAGVSAEFSGTGYADHRFTVTAHDAAGWSAFVAGAAP